jgi:hypothetical protein
VCSHAHGFDGPPKPKPKPNLNLNLNLNLSLNPTGQHYLGEEGEVMEMVLIARKDLEMPKGLEFRV